MLSLLCLTKYSRIHSNLSVAFGDYAEHGLKSQISAEHFNFIMTALRYNKIYAIIISVIGLALISSKHVAQCLMLKLS
ncbi:DUF423 domain-containing protein, partial [Francisella tularensis subsp. holarctica]|nr:DUF423 domain-containing protein [Francisella tularensis subsp. holarctica]